MLIFIFTISLIISLVMIVTAPYQNVLLYKRHSGPQQLHTGYVPRLGGIACFAGLLAGYMLSDFEIQAVFFGLLIAVVPVFLIGEDMARLDEISQQPDSALHLYGKAEARDGRKMGHVTTRLSG